MFSSKAGLLRRAFWELRTEGAGPGREAAAIGIGVFIGCLPVFGLHLLLCLAIGWCLRLNRLKMYLAANISNPFFAPLLILVELEAGALLRRGSFHALTLDTVRNIDPWSFGADLVVGSVAVGGVLGLLTGAVTYALARSGSGDEWFAELVRRASDRYIATSVTAWEFGRGKLRGDPLYRRVLADGVLPPGGTLVDVGCGQGLMLALLIEAADASRGPAYDALIGIETRPRIAAIARQALGGRAAIVEGDARTLLPPAFTVALFFDVLHMMPAVDQEALLESAARSVEPGGVILIRETDATAGWRFNAVRLGNRLKAIAGGNWRQTFHFRTAAEWTLLSNGLGFDVERRGTSEGTPFANVLFVLRRRA
jgi:uncharacterized protein (DUF2062 family)/2-polyprenyl-3-methyl-5-hydroxy-6-metoxy-1,4-benzoquinol methylase